MRGPFSSDEARKLAAASSAGAEFEELFEFFMGFKLDSPSTSVPRNPAEFTRRTAEIIISYELDGPDLDELDDPLGASGEFAMTVSDSRYLDHLRGGTWYSTTFSGHLPSH